jgi:hypothetical protein
MRVFATIVATTMLGLLAGCASSSTTYAPDGGVAHSISCSGLARSWGACYEKAGDLCGAAGYDVMNPDTDQNLLFNGSFGGSKQSRSLLIACKRPAPTILLYKLFSLFDQGLQNLQRL